MCKASFGDYGHVMNWHCFWFLRLGCQPVETGRLPRTMGRTAMKGLKRTAISCDSGSRRNERMMIATYCKDSRNWRVESIGREHVTGLTSTRHVTFEPCQYSYLTISETVSIYTRQCPHTSKILWFMGSMSILTGSIHASNCSTFWHMVHYNLNQVLTHSSLDIAGMRRPCNSYYCNRCQYCFGNTPPLDRLWCIQDSTSHCRFMFGIPPSDRSAVQDARWVLSTPFSGYTTTIFLLSMIAVNSGGGWG